MAKMLQVYKKKNRFLILKIKLFFLFIDLDQYWNQIFSTILFVISGLIFCVIALLWFSTTPHISDKNKELNTYISMGSPSPSTEKKLNQNNAIISVNGSPIALVSIDSLGESFA